MDTVVSRGSTEGGRKGVRALAANECVYVQAMQCKCLKLEYSISMNTHSHTLTYKSCSSISVQTFIIPQYSPRHLNVTAVPRRRRPWSEQSFNQTTSSRPHRNHTHIRTHTDAHIHTHTQAETASQTKSEAQRTYSEMTNTHRLIHPHRHTHICIYIYIYKEAHFL